MSDTTTARRTLLGLLLDRLDTGTLPDAERRLIRPLVDAETRQTADGPSTPRHAADALYEAAAMLQAIGSGTWAEAIECVEARAMTYDHSGGRAPALADRIASSEAVWQSALDRANAETARRERQYTAEYSRADRAEVAIDRVRELHRRANNGETCVYCAPMQRTGYDTTWPCDTIRAIDGPAPDAVLCSPLVNVHCPGHTDGGRCERAASSPVVTAAAPDWEPTS